MLGAISLTTATCNFAAAASESPTTGAYAHVGAAFYVTLEIRVICYGRLHWHGHELRLHHARLLLNLLHHLHLLHLLQLLHLCWIHLHHLHLHGLLHRLLLHHWLLLHHGLLSHRLRYQMRLWHHLCFSCIYRCFAHLDLTFDRRLFVCCHSI